MGGYRYFGRKLWLHLRGWSDFVTCLAMSLVKVLGLCFLFIPVFEV